MSAIELIEKELAEFFNRREAAAKNVEQAIANLHAVEGAIQGAQHLLAKLKQAAAEAEAAVKQAASDTAENSAAGPKVDEPQSSDPKTAKVIPFRGAEQQKL